MRIQLSSGPSLEWPRDLLDVDALAKRGWQPRPFEQFVVKVNSRCNLSCTYCYMYEGPDQSWREQPVRMSDETVTAMARRIAEHAETHGLTKVDVILHGGEPLLAGSDAIDFLCQTVRAELPAGVAADLSLQTNGTLITEAMLEVLGAHQVRVGVSFDGDPVAHDARRVNAAGRGSHAGVVDGLGMLCSPAHRGLFAGLLCVVDPATDPVQVYEELLSYAPPAIDLLLPHAHWSSPPPKSDGRTPTPYGDWLIAAFDRWFDASVPETSIRLFEEIVRGVLGRPSRVELIGSSPVRLAVVETNGDIEQSDALKMAYAGAAATGLNVRRDSFDDALWHPGFVARQIGTDALSPTCLDCDLHPVCGAGFYPHRYRRGHGFQNPSVYCADLTALIVHVQARVRVDLVSGGDRR